jgi:hypothetical protein
MMIEIVEIGGDIETYEVLVRFGVFGDGGLKRLIGDTWIQIRLLREAVAKVGPFLFVWFPKSFPMTVYNVVDKIFCHRIEFNGAP